MRIIPVKLRKEIQQIQWMHICCVPVCFAAPEWEHSFIYAGKQINEVWAIIPLCKFHHRGPGQDKDFSRWIAVNRMTPEDMIKYPRTDWIQVRDYLNNKFGRKPDEREGFPETFYKPFSESGIIRKMENCRLRAEI